MTCCFLESNFPSLQMVWSTCDPAHLGPCYLMQWCSHTPILEEFFCSLGVLMLPIPFWCTFKVLLVLPLTSSLVMFSKGSCQVKNSDWPDYTHAPPIHFFEIFTTIKNNTKITKTHKIPPKKYQSELGFDKPTHPLPSFSRIFYIFFNLTKPLSGLQ